MVLAGLQPVGKPRYLKAEGQAVSWDQNDCEAEVTQFPGFISLTTKVNNAILHLINDQEWSSGKC